MEKKNKRKEPIMKSVVVQKQPKPSSPNRNSTMTNTTRASDNSNSNTSKRKDDDDDEKKKKKNQSKDNHNYNNNKSELTMNDIADESHDNTINEGSKNGKGNSNNKNVMKDNKNYHADSSPQAISSSSSSSSSSASNTMAVDADDNISNKNKDVDDDDDDDDASSTSTQQDITTTKKMITMVKKEKYNNITNIGRHMGISALFAPYRTFGIVCDGNSAFHMISHHSTSDASFLCCSIGNRFALYRTQHLQPVLISQPIPIHNSNTNINNNKKKESSKQHNTLRNNNDFINSNNTLERRIDFCISDPTLSITVVAHGPGSKHTRSNNNNTTDTITLYQRTKAVDSMLVSNGGTKNNNNAGRGKWIVRDMVFMGRIKQAQIGEKDGKVENTAIIAVVLARARTASSSTRTITTKDSKAVIPVDHQHDEKATSNKSEDGSSSNSSTDEDDEDDSSSSSSSSSESSSSSVLDNDDDDDVEQEYMSKILVLVATRTTLRIHNRIPLSSIPSFYPTKAVHPATYINKILLGGQNVMHNNNNNNNETREAAMCLVNIRTGKVIHVFTCLPKKTNLDINNDENNDTVITALEQSPAVDTIAVGTSRGTVHLINLRHDKKLFSLHHKGRGGNNSNNTAVAITSISFRNDGSAMQYGVAPMAVGRSDGTVTIWDLTTPEEKDMGRTVLCELDRIHPGGVSKIQYMPQEPLLLSTGRTSNSILMHIFDSPDHSGRILRQRRGHTAPPCHIRYLHSGLLANAADGTDPSLSCQILSTGGPDRTLRLFSTVRTVLDKEYSQGKGLQKRAKKLGLDSTSELLLPPVREMAMCEARSRDWCDLVTIHQNHSMAYAWSTKQGAQSGPVFKQPHWNISSMKQAPPPGTNATSVAISACGNLVLIGTKGGTIFKYNIQSGIPRGSYPREATEREGERKGKYRQIGDVNRTMKALEKKLKVNQRTANLDKQEHDAEIGAKLEMQLRAKLKAASHEDYAVTGLAVDAVNKTLISVGSDAKLVLWHFSNHAPHKKSPYILPSPATLLRLVRESDLAAVALDDFSVVLFDCNALAVVRQFGKGNAQHSGAICDLGFSPDGRNLYTASLDSTIRVWDVPTNTCVDWLGFKSPPTSLTVSPTGEFLATTHAGRLGISLWSDRSYYQTVHADGRNLSAPFQMDEPVPIGDVVETDGNLGSSKQTSTTESKAEKESSNEKIPAEPKERGLVTLSGLPPSHWKNLFHLELVKERNKPEEAPQKPPSAPFFLQWRKGESITDEQKVDIGKASSGFEDAEEWAAAWSDDDQGDNELAPMETTSATPKRNRNEIDLPGKRQKVKHFRSHLTSLLEQCHKKTLLGGERRYQDVSDHVAKLGPSAIDVALSTLCNGMHDLDEGIHLLLLTCEWLQEACKSCERYEAVNAYLHRFLYLHASVIAGIEDSIDNDEATLHDNQRLKEERMLLIASIGKLKRSQLLASESLRENMEHTLCLLRHFSRMV